MQELNVSPKNGQTRYDAWAYLIIGLLGIPIIALGVGALVLPPGISFSLIRRGLSEGRIAWTALGTLVGIVWMLLLVVFVRRIFFVTRPPAASPPGDTEEDKG